MTDPLERYYRSIERSQIKSRADRFHNDIFPLVKKSFELDMEMEIDGPIEADVAAQESPFFYLDIRIVHPEDKIQIMLDELAAPIYEAASKHGGTELTGTMGYDHYDPATDVILRDTKLTNRSYPTFSMTFTFTGGSLKPPPHQQTNGKNYP